jgi:hypothetical protein
VDTLEDWNRDFSQDVTEAENFGGILPEPIVIERLVQVPGEVQEIPSWTIPVIAVGGLVGLAALLGVFK